MVVVNFNLFYFDKKVLFYVPHGKELRDGYLTKENSYIIKLSDHQEVHVVLDKGDKNDYTKILNKMRDIFLMKIKQKIGIVGNGFVGSVRYGFSPNVGCDVWGSKSL